MSIDGMLPQVGVAGVLTYLLLKLVLDFLGQWRASKNDCVKQLQFEEFLKKFEEHHQDDKQLFRVFERLESAIERQTMVFEKVLRLKD